MSHSLLPSSSLSISLFPFAISSPFSLFFTTFWVSSCFFGLDVLVSAISPQASQLQLQHFPCDCHSVSVPCPPGPEILRSSVDAVKVPWNTPLSLSPPLSLYISFHRYIRATRPASREPSSGPIFHLCKYQLHYTLRPPMANIMCLCIANTRRLHHSGAKGSGAASCPCMHARRGSRRYLLVLT